MSDDNTYNGWANYPTWAINMWLSNDEGTYDEVNRLVRAAGSRYAATEAIEAFVDELNELHNTPTEGFPADLYGWAVGQVDWQEIAEHWIEDNDITLSSTAITSTPTKRARMTNDERQLDERLATIVGSKYESQNNGNSGYVWMGPGRYDGKIEIRCSLLIDMELRSLTEAQATRILEDHREGNMSGVPTLLTSLRDDVASSSTVEDDDRDYIVTRLDEIIAALYSVADANEMKVEFS